METIELNWQQIAMIKVHMQEILKDEYYSETTKAVAEQIINKLEEK